MFLAELSIPYKSFHSHWHDCKIYMSLAPVQQSSGSMYQRGNKQSEQPCAPGYNFMGDQKDSELKTLVIRINWSLQTLGWCPAATWKITPVLGSTGKDVENKEEFCPCPNQWFSHIIGKIFSSGHLTPEKIWKDKMSFEERPQAQSGNKHFPHEKYLSSLGSKGVRIWGWHDRSKVMSAMDKNDEKWQIPWLFQ